MSRVAPSQKRERMTVGSGMALDAYDQRYDVTKWRQDIRSKMYNGLVVGIVVFILVIVIYEWLIAQNRKLTEPYRRQIEAKQQELEKHRQIVSQ